jgi:hypothetical protein
MAAAVLWTAGHTPAVLAESLPENTQALLTHAVEVAFALDLYNSRCRSDLSGRRSENLNKELASRFRLTIIDVQDDYFPEGYYRDAQARMEADFLDRLRTLGGCAGAKAAGLRDTLREDYQQAMAQVARQP